jgi:tRNA pseudouridine13 synthase
MTYPDLSQCAYAYPNLAASAVIRTEHADFQVDEILGYAPDDHGDHILLHIRKEDYNTAFVAEKLAHFAAVKPIDVSYAGLKDRHAITSQWFSVKPKPNTAQPDWYAFSQDNIHVLAAHRHQRKLRRGQLQGNRFRLRLRQVNANPDALEHRLCQIQQHGVPNYFAEQRFGHDGNNLNKAAALFKKELRRVRRPQRSMYLSAARSFLFNQTLSQRIENGTWQHALPGEQLQLAGTHSIFSYDSQDTQIPARLASGDIHTTGTLWGKNSNVDAEVATLEQRIIDQYPVFRDGLLAEGLKAERRALRLLPQDLVWEWQDSDLILAFTLPAGAYATAVLRELATITEAARKVPTRNVHNNDLDSKVQTAQ